MLTREFRAPGDTYVTRVATFVNATELVRYAQMQYDSQNSDIDYRYADWAGMSARDAMRFSVEGDPAFVEPAEKLISEIDAAIPPTPGYEVVRSPFGARVNVSDWLADSPTPMRRRKKHLSDRGVVQIFISFSPSASIDVRTYTQRGAAILALVMKIQQYRPVQVILFEESQSDDGTMPWYSLVHVDSQPLSLAHLGFWVGHPAFFRQVGAPAERRIGINPAKWAPDQYHQDYNKRRNARMGVEPNDVILSSATDWNPLIREPLKWIAAELVRLGID